MANPLSFITDPAYRKDPAYTPGGKAGAFDFITDPAYKGDPAFQTKDSASIGESSPESWIDQAKKLADFAKRSLGN